MDKLKIHFLNTIWSDAIILEKNNHFAFVDTGSKFYYPMIENYLYEHNITKIDFIILTHFHNDHYGNIENIIYNFKVDKLYLKRYYGLDGTTSSGYSSNEEYIKNEFKNYYAILEACEITLTDVIFVDELGCNELEVNFQGTILELYDIKNRLNDIYSNKESKYYQKKVFNENFNCIGIFIREKNHNIFLGADVTCSSYDIKEIKEISLQMINRVYEKHNINSIDLYKSCHHGGGGSNPFKLCFLLKAKYVIITNTAKWLDNYDSCENLEIANNDVKILTTDHQKYIFTIGEEINYKTIEEESLFITLKKK